MADIGKPVRRYKVIPVTEPERRAVPTPHPQPGSPAPAVPAPQRETVPSEPERV